jgi:glucose-1-phosphate adenylyltransferase
VPSVTGNEGIFINSIISNGVIISGGSVQHSILSPGVRVDNGATVQDSILFDNVQVGEHCILKDCIIDKHVVIPANTQIGVDKVADAKRFTVSDQGIVVISEGYQF